MGRLLKVQTGDMLVIDAEAGVLDVEIDEQTCSRVLLLSQNIRRNEGWLWPWCLVFSVLLLR